MNTVRIRALGFALLALTIGACQALLPGTTKFEPSPSARATPVTSEPTNVVATTAPSSSVADATRVPRPIRDEYDAVLARLRERWAPEDGAADGCYPHGTSTVADPSLEQLRSVDQEVAEHGSDRLLTDVLPGLWVGSVESALEAHGGVWSLPVGERHLWIETNRDGEWWGIKLRRYDTPDGNKVWEEIEWVRAYPRECPPVPED